MAHWFLLKDFSSPRIYAALYLCFAQIKFLQKLAQSFIIDTSAIAKIYGSLSFHPQKLKGNRQEFRIRFRPRTIVIFSFQRARTTIAADSVPSGRHTMPQNPVRLLR